MRVYLLVNATNYYIIQLLLLVAYLIDWVSLYIFLFQVFMFLPIAQIYNLIGGWHLFNMIVEPYYGNPSQDILGGCVKYFFNLV